MSRDHLREFVNAVDDSNDPDPELLEFVRDAFSAILAGEKPERALGLTRGRGRPKKQLIVRNVETRVDAAVDVLDLIAEGTSTEDAEAEVGERYHRSAETIRRWRRAHGDFAEGLLQRRYRMNPAISTATESIELIQSTGYELPGESSISAANSAAKRIREAQQGLEPLPPVKEIARILRSS